MANRNFPIFTPKMWKDILEHINANALKVA